MTKPEGAQLSEATRIKRKMLGVRLRSARNQVGLNLKETAQQLGISAATLNAYELGQQEASLPELEAMARIFATPVSDFWSNGWLRSPDRDYRAAQAIQIRRKMLGTQVSQTRREAGRSQAELAEALGCSVERIADYELGQRPIPFSELEKLAAFLERPLMHFVADEAQGGEEPEPEAQAVETQTQARQVGEAEPDGPEAGAAAPPGALPADLAWLADLPEEVRTFLEDPANLLYLKLAMRLHNLSAETLRALAEGILDITY